MFCRNCGKEVQPNAEVCVSCGFKPQKGDKFCQNCGAETQPNQEVCVKCGVKLSKVTTLNIGTGPGKSKIVAGILGILLGGLGIHRFYLGYTGIGILQIVVTFCTCGLGSLWGIIEGILILVGNINKDAQGNPLSD
jgi:TM2 domain-containing membrane protein YozV/ribosomal protein L40E